MENLNRLPDRVWLNRRMPMPGSGNEFKLNDTAVRFDAGEEAVRVSVQGGTNAVSIVTAEWENVIPAGGAFLGDHWERGYGDLYFREKVEGKLLPWYFIHRTDEGCRMFGVRVQPSAFCAWEIRGSSLLLHLDLRCGSRGIRLKGRTVDACEIVMRESRGEDLWNAVKDFLKELCSCGISDGTPVYGANNWYYAYGKSSREELLSDAAYLAEMTAGLENRPFMVIDDGWQIAHTDDYNGGPWRQGGSAYGSMEDIASRMKDLGVRPGIWFRPLLDISPEIPLEWRSMRDQEVLDVSVPEVLEHIAEDVRTIASWGYELLKYDFSTFDIFGKWGFRMGRRMTDRAFRFRNENLTNAELIKNLYRVIYENAGGMLVLGCNCVGHLGAGLMQANRTGDDTSGVDWSRTRKMGVNTLAFRMPQHEIFFAADADCVGITELIPWEKNRQWLELLSVSGTPFFVSVRPGTLTEDQEEELRKAYGKASENRVPAVPLDWESGRLPKVWDTFEGVKKFNW